MREEAFDLINALSREIVAHEAFADELVDAAEAMRRHGELALAMGLCTMIRNHRIRAMENRGRLAALSKAYGGTYHSE